MSELAGKVAIVTGGAQGIGRGITEHLAALGMDVVVADIDRDAGLETAEAAASFSGRVVFLATDVGREDSVRTMVERSRDEFSRIDALINNAGIAGANSGPVERLALADWNRRLSINLTGPFLCAKHAVPLLRQSRGSIVNIASTRALQSEPDCEAYAASKGGLVALTHALAVSLGPEIRANAISPGWIDVRHWRKKSHRSAQSLTEADHAQHPVGRVGQPSDIAALAAYLISDSAGFITGQNFIVDGGMTRRMIYFD